MSDSVVIYFASARWFKVCDCIVGKASGVFYEYGTDPAFIVLGIRQVLQCLNIKYSELWSSLECQSFGLVRFKSCLFFCFSESLRHQSSSVAVTIEHLYKQQNLTDKVVDNRELFGASCQATGCTTVTCELCPSICETPMKTKVILTKVFYQSLILILFCFVTMFPSQMLLPHLALPFLIQ